MCWIGNLARDHLQASPITWFRQNSEHSGKLMPGRVGVMLDFILNVTMFPAGSVVKNQDER
jgi:hypothetical protein